MLPQTRYAKSGGIDIAYQVLGEGPPDLVLVPGWVSNLDAFWEEPTSTQFLRRLGTFSRLILFDKRGTGLSDRVADMPSLEVRMDDLRAVMDAVGSERAALFGYSEGGADVRAIRCYISAPYHCVDHGWFVCPTHLSARLSLGNIA
jgi:pimeloyl-ACP methyl ester carboxylesterase